jgi:hypothetical protein
MRIKRAEATPRIMPPESELHGVKWAQSIFMR